MDLKALAASLNLSQTTVSRALNGYSDVSEKTRARVLAAAQALAYQANPIARSLAMGRANAIGIVQPIERGDVSDPRFLDVIAGLTEGLAPAQIDLLVASSTPEGELATYARLVQGKRVDGFLVARTLREDPRIAYLREAKVPFLAYGRSHDSSAYPWFDFDNGRGSELAVERLLTLGHRRIAYIHAGLHYNFAYARQQGFVAAMRAAGIELAEDDFIAAALSRSSGYTAMSVLLARKDRPSALIIDNNLAGEGAMRAALDHGLVLGRELSLIIYDGAPPDTPLGGIHPTSIIQPSQHNAGQAMAELLRKLLAGGHDLAQMQMLCQPALQIGDSDGPPLS